ncbi:MAG: hypothetical protein WD534_05720, partial [Phycisphaeraceae bacterium]
IEGNPLWEYHDAFNPDKAEVEDLKARYRAGKVGDGECKMRLADVINDLLEPMRHRRAELEADPDQVLEILRDGTRRANAVAEQTLKAAKAAMKFDFFDRKLEM